MKIKIFELNLSTSGRNDILDITRDIERFVDESGIINGIVNVFGPGSTCGITTMEYEKGLKKDLAIVFEKIAPSESYYYHHETWGDDNGSSHVLSSLIKPFYILPVVDGKLVRGTWQQIAFVEFDTRPRERRLIIQVLGE
jgi:secondary thiamine-phosphate synthase enzyme